MRSESQGLAATLCNSWCSRDSASALSFSYRYKYSLNKNCTSMNNIILVTPFNGFYELENVVSRKSNVREKSQNLNNIRVVTKHIFFFITNPILQGCH